MPLKTKVSAEEKARLVQDCVAGRLSRAEAARRAEVDERSLYRWIARYEAEGSVGFIATEKNRIYSEETKLQAVEEYLAGRGSLEGICKKYKIRSERQLRNWIQVYNSGRDFKKMSGGSRMKNTRKTQQEPRTEEERLQIEIAQLKHELYLTRMERDLLKKLEEIERREAYRK